MRKRSDLRPYQERAVEFFKANLNCAGFIDLGLGKTVCTLTAFADMQQSFDARHMLVVAPLRVARDVWHIETQEWEHTSHLSTVRIIGDKYKRLDAMNTRAHVHTINRENFLWLAEQFVQGKKQVRRWPWDTVVLDEASGYRHQSSERWKATKRLRKLFPRLIELTGTPRPNGLAGLWAMFYLLDRGLRLGIAEKHYKEKWFTPQPYSEYAKWLPKPHAEAEIIAAISDITLTLREEDYLSLPPVMTNVIKVYMPLMVDKQYRRLENHALLETFTGSRFRGVNAGVLAGKLLQLANGAMYTGNGDEWELLHNAKLDALLELLEDQDGPALIAYNYVSDLERLQTALGPFCTRLHKRFDVLKTEKSIADWNAGKTDFLLLHPASAGHGLNLQHGGAETIIWFGNTYDGELHDQLNARLAGGHRRAGRNIVIHYLVTADTIDEAVIEALREKKLGQDNLMRLLSARAGGTGGVMLPVPQR